MKGAPLIVAQEIDLTGLTGKALELLEVLQAHPGEWLTRSDIAPHVGKKRLNDNDHNQLDNLEAAGLIEKRQVPYPGITGKQWEYRYNE